MNKFAVVLALCVGLIIPFHAAHAQICGAPSTNCPDYTALGSAPLPQNSTISLEEIAGAPNSTAAQALNNAAANMNSLSSSNGTNNTINYGTITVTNQAPTTATSPTIVVQWNTTTTNTVTACGGSSACSGMTQLSNYAGAGVTSSVCTITVYLAQVYNGVQAYNPNVAGYAGAIQRTIEHEMSHCYGVGDAVMPTDTTSSDYSSQMSAYDQSIMSPFIVPNNNSGSNGSTPTNCDIVALSKVIASFKTGSTCPVP
jgi:hypothetical protein